MNLQERLTPNPAFGKGTICSCPHQTLCFEGHWRDLHLAVSPAVTCCALTPQPYAELFFPSCLCFPRLLLPLLQNQATQLWRSLSCYLYLLHTNTAKHLSHFLDDTRLSPTEELQQAFFLTVSMSNIWVVQKPSNLWQTQNWTCQGARRDHACV